MSLAKFVNRNPVNPLGSLSPEGFLSQLLQPFKNQYVKGPNKTKKGKHQNMGGCQNYGPFLGPYYNTAPSI